MLGFAGFIIAAVAIGMFVWSTSRAYVTVGAFRLQAFNAAFILLAAAMVSWALIVAMNDPEVTRNFMLVSDMLLLIGTACMAIVMAGRLNLLSLTAVAVGVAVLGTYRAYIQPPTAFVRDGLLYFNLQGSSRLFIVGLFALVWLPAAMFIANRIANDPLLTRWRYSLQMYFVLMVALLAMFAKARRAGAIIALFGAIILVFVLITLFNRALLHARLAESKPAPKGKAIRHATV